MNTSKLKTAGIVGAILAVPLLAMPFLDTTPAAAPPEPTPRPAPVSTKPLFLVQAPTPTPTPASQWRVSIDGLQDFAETQLKESLRDPKSYESVKWQRYKDDTVKAPHQVWGLTYRARNGFGGMNVEEQLYIFSPNGDVAPYANKTSLSRKKR